MGHWLFHLFLGEGQQKAVSTYTDFAGSPLPSHPPPIPYFMTSLLKEKLEILEKLDETVLESIENDAETDKEIQESTDFRRFMQETCTEIDLCLKEYVKNEQPEQGQLQILSTPQLFLHFQVNRQV